MKKLLGQWISVTMVDDESDLASLCLQLRRNDEFSILIDRRLNPSRQITLQGQVAGSLEQVLQEIARSQQAAVELVGETALIIPRTNRHQLRTLIEILKQDFRSYAVKNRQLALRLGERRDFQWNRFAVPRKLIATISNEFGLTIVNPELIPHDLWRAGELRGCNAFELLSIILCQLELTCRWQQVDQLELVPVPASPEIDRSHRISGQDVEQLQAELELHFPGRQWQRKNSKVIQVSGPLELHEAIEWKLSGKSRQAPSSRIPWQNRRFTIKVDDKALQDVLQYLQQAGIPVEFDLQKLQQQGYDVKQKLTFTTTEADARELFEKICQPQQIPFLVTQDAILIGQEAD